MQAIKFLRDEGNNHRLIQIDIDDLGASEDLLEDVLDFVTVEMRRNEETVSWEEVKQSVREKSNN